ncbi:MAG: response regulator [Alphaproteobacteria bacterium]
MSVPLQRQNTVIVTVLLASGAGGLVAALYLGGILWLSWLVIALAVAFPAGWYLLVVRAGTQDGPGSAARHIDNRYKELFNQSPVAMAQIDSAHRIAASNLALRRLFGDDAPDGRAFEEFVAEEHHEVLRQRLTEIAAGNDSESSLVVSLANDSDYVVSVYAAQLVDDGSVILTLIDTTRLSMLEQQIAQSQKMQAVGQLAGGIAHDFNNLLTAMIGFCDLLLQRHRAGDQSFADIMQIKQNANRAARLVRQLLAFSRQQTLEPQFLSVADVLAELTNLLQRLLGERVQMTMTHGRDLGLVKVDQGQLDQVVINLAVNARDAMAETGGEMTIATDHVTVRSPIRAHGEEVAPGDYVAISVRDTGTGIKPENLERIFDPFFTTKEVGAGTGLGLSTVYGIVKQTGGYILVESGGEGQGTTFTVLLKRYDVQERENAAESERLDAPKDVTGGGTVFLVEDEDPVRLFGARALRSKGYKVIEARNGEAALELMDSEKFDLLITDMVMPRVGGAEVIREARRTHGNIPVICISGYTEESILREVEAIENVTFLPKPFSLQQLAGKVKDAMESR